MQLSTRSSHRAYNGCRTCNRLHARHDSRLVVRCSTAAEAVDASANKNRESWHSTFTQGISELWKNRHNSPAGQTEEPGKMHFAASFVAPLASVTAAQNANQELFYIIAKLLDFYIIIMMVRVILSWFRGVDFYKEPWTYLRELTDPYMNIFRGLIPPFGRVDVSPILGFILLQFIQRFFASLAGISS